MALILIVLISKYILVTAIRKLAEYLNLKPHTVGNIAGFATSIPELLTTCVSSLAGLPSAGLYNILSSNIINFIQFFGTVIINKNLSGLKNRAIKVNIVLAIITIIIPLLIAVYNIEMGLYLVPLLLMIFILFIILNNEIHRSYLRKEDRRINKIIEKETKEEIKKRKVCKYVVILALSSILLYFVGNFLGDTIEVLCINFNVSQMAIGVLLGFFTSLPEFIAFFESQRHHNKNENDIVGMVEAANGLLMSNVMNLFIILTLGIWLINI
jgi:Ca2+/Na+ antiporter